MGASFTIGGMTGLTAFANYTDANTGQKVFFWGGSGGLYRVRINTQSFDFYKFMVSNNYSTIKMSKCIQIRFNLTPI